MADINYDTLAQKQKRRAFEIISDTRLIDVWQQAGARVNLIGSLEIGVLAKHRDIDFHIYTDRLNVKQSFAIIAEICANPAIKKCEFSNLAQTDEKCFEWHLYYEDAEHKLWQIDLIQILSGSQYDGYFENVAKTIKQAMTEEMRQTILKLKFETPDDMKISGIEYYKAVIQDDIKSYDDFLNWRTKQNFNGIIKW